MASMKLINVKAPGCISLNVDRIKHQSNTSRSAVIRTALKIGLLELERSMIENGNERLTRIIIDSEKNNSEVV